MHRALSFMLLWLVDEGSTLRFLIPVGGSKEWNCQLLLVNVAGILGLKVAITDTWMHLIGSSKKFMEISACSHKTGESRVRRFVKRHQVTANTTNSLKSIVSHDLSHYWARRLSLQQIPPQYARDRTTTKAFRSKKAPRRSGY